MPKQKTTRINIYRLRLPSLFDDFDPSRKGYRLEYSDDQTKLFVHPGRNAIPPWVDYMRPLISRDSSFIKNRSSGFVLMKRHGGNLYALTGGYGYTEIREAVLEDFGLQLVLRMLDETGIASIKQRSLKGSVRQIMRAVSGYDPLFDSENYNRILDGLEGKVNFEGRQFRVMGRSSVVLRTERPVDRLNEVFDELEDIIGKEPKVTFPRSYEEVIEGGLIQRLEDDLLQSVRKFWRGESDRDQIYLEFSDPLVQFRCEKFMVKYDRRSIEVEEFDLEIIRDALKEKGANEPETLQALSKFRVTGVNEFNFNEFENHTFARLIVYETSMDGRHYIRFGNRWYAILDDVQAFLDQELSRVTVDSSLLPEWDKNLNHTENEYNKWVAEQYGWHCLDADLVHLPNRSKIELCDLFDSDNIRLVHVKETWGAKSAYLFAQGVTAAEFYNNSKEFRDKCDEKWPGLLPEPSANVTIVFAVADSRSRQSTFPLNLTYFGKLSCYNAVSGLRAHGFNVVLAPVGVTDRGDK